MEEIMGVDHHLDRRAAELSAAFRDQDQLLDEKERAARLGYAPITVRIWRSKGEGPPFIRVSRRGIRRHQRPGQEKQKRPETRAAAHHQ